MVNGTLFVLWIHFGGFVLDADDIVICGGVWEK